MAELSVVHGDFYFDGNHVFGGTLTVPDGSITDDAVVAAAGITASKLQRRISLTYDTPVSEYVSPCAVKLLHVCRAAGTLIGVKALVAVLGTKTTGTTQVTVDVKRAAAGGALASVLTSVITLDTANVIYTAEDGTFSATTLAAGDVLALVIDTVQAGDGVLPKGLLVELTLDEAAQ